MPAASREKNMHLDDLEIFIDVAVQGSFSKAAIHHELAQPTITLKIQALEKQLGVDLFDRKRPLGLTPAGELFFDGAKKLIEDYRVLVNSVSHFGDRVVGHIQVVAIYSVGLLKMEECLKEFNERYPDARADIRYEHPEQVMNLVLNGSAQIGLLSFPEEKRDLVVTPWQDQPLVLVVNPRHNLASLKSVSVQALEGEAFIAFTNELAIRKRMDKWLREQHVTVNVVQQFDNIGQIKEGVGEGSGIAILPAPTVRREVDAGLLVAIPFSDVSWSRPLGIIHRRQRAIPTSVQKFVELLTQKSSSPPTTVQPVASRTPRKVQRTARTSPTPEASTSQNAEATHTSISEIAAAKVSGSATVKVPDVQTSNYNTAPASDINISDTNTSVTHISPSLATTRDISTPKSNTSKKTSKSNVPLTEITKTEMAKSSAAELSLTAASSSKVTEIKTTEIKPSEIKTPEIKATRTPIGGASKSEVAHIADADPKRSAKRV